MNIQLTVKRFLNKGFVLSCALLLLLSATPAKSAATSDPIQLLQSITQQMIKSLENSRDGAKHNVDTINRYINAIVLPHVDFTEMSRWVVGRNAWNEANTEEKEAFIDAFERLVVRSYAQFLLRFSDETIKFYPLREKIGEQKQIHVSSEIQRSSGSPIRMDYAMILKEGDWKVVDIIIEEASLLDGYQAQLVNYVQQGGIAAATAKLRKMTTPKV